MILLEFLNIFFIVFHTGLILFNSLGWIVRRWRKWNLLTLLLTAVSWFGLGYFYGWGYCFCTDWHWNVREELGYQTYSNSYISFLAELISGYRFDDVLVNNVTAAVFFASLAISIFLNIRDRQLRKLSHSKNI